MIASDLEECKSNCVVDAECQVGPHLVPRNQRVSEKNPVARASLTRAGVFVKSGSAREDLSRSLRAAKRTRNPGDCR